MFDQNKTAPTRHDNIDSKPIVKRIADILPLSVVTADKGYNSEENHLLVRDGSRYEHVPIWRTQGMYDGYDNSPECEFFI